MFNSLKDFQSLAMSPERTFDADINIVNGTNFGGWVLRRPQFTLLKIVIQHLLALLRY